MPGLCALSSLLFLFALPTTFGAAPTGKGSADSPFWLGDASLHSLGKSAFNPDANYKVFRNVKDFGAVGDGVADDTAAFNKAISDTNRCGLGCNSSTIAPGLVYVPAGTYRLTTPVIPYYFTSLVGDANNRPVLKADAGFKGIAVIDGDPYQDGVTTPDGGGVNWWTNQNNFFRSIRNFVIDVTAMPASSTATGVHWQVGQATSLINLELRLSQEAGNQHQGIFAENGSGGFISDITVIGGNFGLWISNQQFTLRNIKVSNAVTAIFQRWNWGFTWQGVEISDSQVGWDIFNGGLTLENQTTGANLFNGGLTSENQTTGANIILDSSVKNTDVAIRFSTAQPTSLAGSLVIDNVDFSGIKTANIQDPSGVLLAPSEGNVRQWFQGNVYAAAGGRKYVQGTFDSAPTKPTAILDQSGKVFAKSRPQYGTFTAEQFLSVKAKGGAKGDGVTDDSDALNDFISKNAAAGIIYFDAGTYLVTKTIFIPADTIVVGEMFSTILASGNAFSNPDSPTPVVKVGNDGDKGSVEISDIVVSTVGGSAGAIAIEWNVAGDEAGSTGMWDVHVRLGGSKGTNIDVNNCPTSSTDAKCTSAFLGLHVAPTGSGYFENVWVWNADHDLDDPAQGQINSFSARGILIETKNPVWLVGTASEHHVFYQYQFLNAENVYAGLIQTETPYFQPVPALPTPFKPDTAYGDPQTDSKFAYGLIITKSKNVFVYGAGLYSFFNNYDQACVDTRACQTDITLIDNDSSNVYIYQLTTVSTTNTLTQGSKALILQADNINGFASTATFWSSN